MPPSTLVDMLKQVHLTGAYSDLEIRCGDYAAKVHKVVVCSQSEWFAKAVADGLFVEGQTGTVTLHDTTPQAARAIIQFMYTHDYSLASTSSSSVCQQLLDHLDVYALADMIQHTDLRATTKRKFNALLHKDLYSTSSGERAILARTEAILRRPYTSYYASPSPVRSIAALEDGDLSDSQPVAEQGLGNIHTDPHFLPVIIRAFGVAPPNQEGEHLKQMAFDRMMPHIKYLFEDHQRFATMMEIIPELGQKVWDGLIEKKQPGEIEKVQEDPKTPLHGSPRWDA